MSDYSDRAVTVRYVDGRASVEGLHTGDNTAGLYVDRRDRAAGVGHCPLDLISVALGS